LPSASPDGSGTLAVRALERSGPNAAPDPIGADRSRIASEACRLRDEFAAEIDRRIDMYEAYVNG
jgi:hypothetical protein